MDPEKIAKIITKKTKAIIPVHLYGQSCCMDKIIKIAKKYNIKVIEDCAQAQGALFNKKKVGNFGVTGCFSFYPTKILGAYGDGGFITTNDESIYQETKILRNHGLVDRNTVEHFGYVSRMDNLQASILNYRAEKLSYTIQKRRQIAEIYFENLLDFIPKGYVLRLPGGGHL